MDTFQIIKIAAAVLALVIAIVGHEIMHGYVAYKYGDMTAKDAGRLSINPLVHIDLFGTIIVPAMLYFIPMLFTGEGGFLFGWAKPVPVDMREVINRGGYNAAMQVSLAGIVYNFTLAVFASIALTNMSQPSASDGLFYLFIYLSVLQLLIINVVLGVFNLIPVPAFDGANFLSYLALKYKKDAVAEFFFKNARYGMVIVLIMLMTPLKDYLLILPVQFILHQLI